MLVLFLAAGRYVTSGFERTFVPALGGAFGLSITWYPMCNRSPQSSEVCTQYHFYGARSYHNGPGCPPSYTSPTVWIAVVIVLMYTVMAVAAVQRVGVFLLFADKISPLSVGPTHSVPSGMFSGGF